MAIIQKINTLIKKKYHFLTKLNASVLKIQNFKPFIIIGFLIFFSAIYFISSNLINKINKENKNNLEEITKSNGFLNLSYFLIKKMNSPYEEISYVIKNNDTVEKILKEFNIRKSDIRDISIQLKKKKLANIY